jgi:Na+/H+-dicarboxylate symporter
MKLHWKIIAGMLLGIFWAVGSAYLGLSSFNVNWIAPFGEIFINLLKLIALPLVLFSVIGGIIGIGDPKHLGKMGGKTIGLYIISTILAITLGLTLVNIFQPGKILNEATLIDNRISYELWANNENIEIKDNICILCQDEYADKIKLVSEDFDQLNYNENIEKKLQSAKETKYSGPLQPLVDLVPPNIFSALSGGPMLQVIFFAIFFGIAVLYIPSKQATIITDFINSMNEVFLKMIDFIMQVSPFFVFALMAGIIAEMAGDDITKMFEIFKGLSFYTLLTMSGLAIMIFVVYPLVLKILVNQYGYMEFFRKIAPAQMLAFTTSSSAATLPVTIDCVENNLKIDKKISGFVLPIGATINMDGTSLYQAVAAVFLAQIHMIDLSIGQQLTIIATATLASIGSAAVPSAGLVMLMIVLTSVGLNPAWIALILPVDRILDMCRTTVNVTGDATVTAIIAKSESREL